MSAGLGIVFIMLQSTKAVALGSFYSQQYHGWSTDYPCCPSHTSVVPASGTGRSFLRQLSQKEKGLLAIALPCRNLVISWANKGTLAIYLASYSLDIIISLKAIFLVNAMWPWLQDIHGVWPSGVDFLLSPIAYMYQMTNSVWIGQASLFSECS